MAEGLKPPVTAVFPVLKQLLRRREKPSEMPVFVGVLRRRITFKNCCGDGASRHYFPSPQHLPSPQYFPTI